MKAIVFCGPTLRRDEVDPELGFEVRPPAARGDVLRAALCHPQAIGVVDGYFDRVPSVWHKEILWAMTQGIRVFGAASMGALRAAELAAFGMEGVGAIYDGYRTGRLVADDEVAVIHAGEDEAYRPLSEAMVNIRATLAAAEGAGVVRRETRLAMEGIAKSLPYPERSYPMLLALTARTGLADAEVSAFRDWLATGRVDQKRDDAKQMLARMAQCARDGWPARDVSYPFSRTDAWEALWNEVRHQQPGEGRASAGESDEARLFDELLASGEAARACDGALARALCVAEAQRVGVEIDARAVEEVIDDFRREHSLLASADFERWIAQQDLTETQLVAFFRREALVRRMHASFETDARMHLADYLRAKGRYVAIAARAAEKTAGLARRGIASADLSDTKLTDARLWAWFFERRWAREVPADLESFARAQHASVEQLRAAAIREYLHTLEEQGPQE